MNTKSYLNSLNLRNGILNENLTNLRLILEDSYERDQLEAGVIDRGYYTSFNGVLNKWRSSGEFDRFMLSEEQIVDGSNLVKIPVVDLFKNGDSKRIFIISKSLRNKYGLN